MAYEIVPSSSLAVRRGYPKHDWPLTELQIGQSFVIQLAQNQDIDGRHEPYIRTIIHKASQRLGRKLSCRKTEDGDLAVIRMS